MDIIGTRVLQATPEQVWAHLISPASLEVCIPGCESVEGDPEAGFDMVVSQNLGLTTARFAGRIELEDVVPARRVTLIGRGKGGVAGLAEGRATITLTPVAEGTEIAWDLGALVEGRLAKFGTRIIQGVANKMTGFFADRLAELLAAESQG